MSYNANTRTILDIGANDGVSINDVQRALGNGSRDLGTLCSAPSINKWARFKPVAFPMLGQITWRNNVSAHFGLQIIQSNTESGLINQLKDYVMYLEGITSSTTYKDYDGGVKYIKPSGGINAPYRLTDFVCKEFPSRLGYHASAEPQFAAPKGNNTYTAGLGSVLGGDEYIFTGNDGGNLPQFDSYDYEWECWDGALMPESFIGSYTPTSTPLNLDLSVQEIIMACVLTPSKTDLYRGIVLIEPNAGVYWSQYHWNDSTQIPWASWRDSLVEVGTWWRFDVYSMTGKFCIIPSFMKKISFSLGGNSIAFALQGEENNVGEATVQNNKANVWFRVVAGNINEWYRIRVVVTKKIGTMESTPYFDKDLSDISTQTSGATWYVFDFGVDSDNDNWTVQPTDRFYMRIYGTLYSSSMEKIVSEKTLVLTS